jgi:hypothetical protein
MYPLERVSSSEALLLIGKTIDEANKIKKQIAIAVCGPEGEFDMFFKDGWSEPSGIALSRRIRLTPRPLTERTRD